MTPDGDLERACARYGVAVRYRDFWQNEHVPSEATLRAVLAAMGANDGPSAECAPPLVWRSDAIPDAFDLRLPAQAGADALRWHVALESGGRHEGPCGRATDGEDTRVRCEGVPRDVPPGQHRVVVTDPKRGGLIVATTALLVCPPRCAPSPSRRVFGPTIQLYALRSARNWGIGDFTDLAALIAMAAAEGADFVGLNPLHELFHVRPEDASPYSPSTRLAINPLYIDVEALEDFASCEVAREHVASPAFQARLATLRANPLVDYAGVAEAKVEVLRHVFDHFDAQHLTRPSERGFALRAFAGANPELAWQPALFDALHAELLGRDANAWGWPAWPASMRDADGPEVQDFARAHRREVDFYLYLQWQADRQLAACARGAKAAGMAVGLYRDLAVGANPGGAETWQAPTRFALDVHVGAPPDEFNRKGQDWGLPPWIPHRLRANGYEAWIALLRANMRHAGALRIDHVMALLRLFWIPEGMTPTQGTYVAYPLDDLLAVLALESRRHGCAVVGEDLGTVPDEVRTALRDAGVHSYRVLWFERNGDGTFLPSAQYPTQALCSVTTHDLPTLEGFWRESDITARTALDLFPEPALREQQLADRSADRARLWQALGDAQLVEASGPPPRTLDDAALRAVHAFMARSPCALMAVQLEDVFGETQQVNLPATTEAQYPNWRRKITVALEDWASDGRFARICAAIRAEGRGRAAAAGAP